MEPCDLFDKTLFDKVKFEFYKDKYASVCLRRVWKYQRGINQNPLIEWRTVNAMSKRKNNKRTINDLQNTAQKTEDQATRTH